MTAKLRTDLLTTTELYHLDVACRLIFRAFGDPPYLVGSAGMPGNRDLIAAKHAAHGEVAQWRQLDEDAVDSIAHEVAKAVVQSRSYRDVDVRLMLDDEQFAATCPTRERWELLSLAISAYLRDRTGLPIDFQIQLASEANAKFSGSPRNPLGMGRAFAGGGDATPEWAPDQEPSRTALTREVHALTEPPPSQTAGP
jgi:hypothetical protein